MCDGRFAVNPNVVRSPLRRRACCRPPRCRSRLAFPCFRLPL